MRISTGKLVLTTVVSLALTLSGIAATDAIATGNGNGNGGGNGAGDGTGPIYFNPATVQTLTGTLTKQYSDWTANGSGYYCGTGQHFEFTSGGTAYSLILGPAWFLSDNGISLSVGDNVTVTGSVVDAYLTGYADLFIIAIEIQGVQLRDADGYPLWRGGNGANGRGIGRGPRGQNYYDPSSVGTYSGTLSESLNFWMAYGNGNYTGSGMHYIFTANGEAFYLMLGPWRYLEDNGIELEKGLKLSVTGSVVSPYFDGYADHDYLIAKSITVGDKTVQLRDDEGYPFWRGGNALNYNAPAYDTASVGAINGAVIGVRTRTHGKNFDPGLELRVRAANQNRYTVYLGPQYYCENLGLAVANGDQVRIRGSIRNRDCVAATIQINGGRQYRLRGNNGSPRWVNGN
jgi:hypothetical protein